ncbi:UDP-2,4-diacetamido-2,4,6-trideoxy-beta-L-altropyranose hydrolase [Sporolactobacillus putidus]|uniref:UDP-2,4-diacetamido-2,4, 6-trideoxy-beta-L-altropyranose hydrolase n=1 Tax=Sporolactobacillus putidus TaxID=492735 RepID=A0A917S4A8_9BACL|nr:UDP-2,4-diacetamido-2,4,6-trideoxy-beta-L-altropyranose hydrolase [Sporolactobacillus putidus]GGL54463.1 UDP-2,4-diacetamido-2,4,6-trideoxy-beta-L-altropyranose hydrolase [Sporolactobacillus putidus]
MKNIGIRVDASVCIGSGHIMRCLTLANQLKRAEINVVFFCRELKGNLNTLVRQNGFKIVELRSIGEAEESNIWQWYDENWFEDARELLNLFRDEKLLPDLLIVDHYGLDEKWETVLCEHSNRIMVIDDLANRKHRCSILLDQNVLEDFLKRYDDLVPDSCQKLLGPDYILFRDEFIHSVRKERTGAIANILVSFGGTDPQNETLRVVKLLSSLNQKVTVNVVVGQSNKFRHEIQHFCSQFENFYYFCQVSDMVPLINQADIAIGAGGISMWERCFLGLPSIVMAIADNQIRIAEEVRKLGAIIYLGESRAVSSEQIKESVHYLLNHADRVQSLSRCGSNIFNKDKIKSFPVVRTILGVIK